MNIIVLLSKQNSLSFATRVVCLGLAFSALLTPTLSYAMPACTHDYDDRYSHLRTYGESEQSYTSDSGSVYHSNGANNATAGDYYGDPVRVFCTDAGTGVEFSPTHVGIICEGSSWDVDVDCHQCTTNLSDSKGIFVECRGHGSVSVRDVVCNPAQPEGVENALHRSNACK